MSKIKLYDTVKDKNGNRFRVTEVKADDGRLVATLRMLDKGGLQKKGRPRKVDMKTLEADYTRVDLPEVTVRKIDDLSEEEREMVKVFGSKDKDEQNENKSLTGLSEEEVEQALAASTFGGEKEKPQPHTLNDTFDEFKEKQRSEDLEVLKAECISLKEENKKLHAKAKDGIQEVVDLKKTISKMKQEHEAEVRELNDALMEAKAETNAVRKSKEEALSKYTSAMGMIDSDSVAFEAILDLAHIAQSVSQSLYTVSKRIEAETEGHI